ncbi:sensor histidine kinase [Peptococcus simiae]|uniref:histidine kinase n=1 Tax=Peptococcus simiae TaxID=1643805 RepID=A0ABW9H1W9_9FIRM
MSLSKKISFVLLSVVTIGGLLIGGLTIDSTTRSFDQFLFETRQSEITEWYDIFMDYYETHDNSWEGVERLNVSEEPDRTMSLGQAYQRPIVLVSQSGQILVHPQKNFIGLTVDSSLLNHGFPLERGEEVIGYLLPVDYFDHKFWVLEESFIRNVSHSVIKGILATNLIAFIIALVLSQNMVQPLRKLIENVRKMGKSDHFVPVVVYSDDEIGELASAFNQMGLEIEKNSEARTRLFSDVSHELRTPLTAIAASLENKLLRTESLSPVEISALYDEVLRMTNLVKELQSISRLDAGHIDLSKTLIDFKSFFADFFVLLDAEAASRDIQVTIDTPDNLPYCYADPERLKQIVLNLVSNAMRYSNDGGQVTLAAEADDKYFIITVKDNGLGMSPQDLAHVFDRFYRSDASRARDTGGSGLGLAITKGLVDAHDGVIQVSSQLGEGTIFTVRLPLYQGTEAED